MTKTELEISLEKQLADAKASIARQNASVMEEKANFFRNQLLEMGDYTDAQKARINKIGDVESLKFMIEDKKNQIIEGEDKRKEADAKKKKDEKSEDDEKGVKTGKMNVNASNRPIIKAPSGKLIEADPSSNIFNEAIPMAHFVDPMQAPKHFNLFMNDARPNPLPPDKDHPYYRAIA